ncbi:FAD-binding domain-containing protein [Xylariomycetidae sp. FL2044]|nr:FAD-binding domain-containing protein [Xylariomycetidae sp. FL2044]
MSTDLGAITWPVGVKVLTPASDAYHNATVRWSLYGAPSFKAAITPSTEEELASVVKIAGEAKVPFLATSGRHGYVTTLKELRDGLAIDLSRMKSIAIDKDAATLTIGAGVQIGDIMSLVEDAGFMLPVGSCTQVGVIGATIGGGVGVFQGVLGLMVDSLLSARLLTAKGTVVEASETNNPDLFWAIRGGGPNFGIITSATYKLHKQVNNAQIFTADLIFPSAMKVAYFDILTSFEDTMPPELGINTAIAWDQGSNATQIIGTFVYTGPEADARRILAPFYQLNPPVVRDSVVPYSEVPNTLVFGMIAAMAGPGVIRDTWSVNIRRFSAEKFLSAFYKFDAFFQSNPAGRRSVALMETFPSQAMEAVPAESTAYPWREAKGNLMFQFSWPELGDPVEEIANALGRDLRSAFAADSGYSELAVLSNYAQGDEAPENKFGRENMGRLVAVKKQWDPDNAFGFYNGIPVGLS